MKKKKIIMSIIIILALSFCVFSGCSKKNDNKGTGTTGSASPTAGTITSPSDKFSYSDGIDDNGYWVNVKAADHVEINGYNGISIPSDVHTVSDEDIKSEIDYILSDYAERKEVKDRAVVDGDTVNIDFVGRIDGVEFEGGSTNGYGTDVTIGVTQYIDDFLEQIIGHKPGETFDVEVTFPEDYGKEDLNGKDAVFTVTLNYIVESTLPDLNDAFVAEKLSQNYGWKTVAEMESYFRELLQRDQLASYIQNYLFENAVIKSIPDSMMKYQENSIIRYMQDQAEVYSLDLSAFLKAYVGVSSTEELLEMTQENNRRNSELHLILQAIAEKENIKISDDDVGQYFLKYSGSDDYSMYKDFYGMPYLKMNVLNEAVFDYLIEKAVFE